MGYTNIQNNGGALQTVNLYTSQLRVVQDLQIIRHYNRHLQITL
jgi:hypothetical protein